MAKGNFPSFLKKTDEPRVQNFPDVLKEIYGIEMIGTMKCDGTSTTYYLREDEFGVCSRNLNLTETPDNSQWAMARKLDIEGKMRKFRDLAKYHDWDFKDFAIQGELCGNSIQANKMKLDGLNIFFFNFWDITNHKYRSFETLQNFCKLSELQTVPVVFRGILPNDLLTVESILRHADKLDYPNGGPAEGIVWRSFIEKDSMVLGGRLSFKTNSNRFLLKSENN
jgi:RNA ligase (TIGR02306 family)